MATSGTVNQTVLDTSVVIDHALRRCGIFPHAQTPEIVYTAKNNLFFLLNHYTTRGLALWCVKQRTIPLLANKQEYALPSGDIRVLKAAERSFTEASGTNTAGTVDYLTEFTEEQSIRMFSVMCSADTTLTATLEVSTDNVTYTAVDTYRVDCEANVPLWITLDPTVSGVYFRLTETVLLAVPWIEIVWATGVIDGSLYQMNKDEYFELSNKNSPGSSVSQYWFDRQISPNIHVWPVPSSSGNALHLFVQQQIEDVGSLSQQLAIPIRWYDTTIWQLALRLCFELPGVTPERVKLVSEMAEKFTFDIETEEHDGSGTYLSPDISGYNC